MHCSGYVLFSAATPRQVLWQWPLDRQEELNTIDTYTPLGLLCLLDAVSALQVGENYITVACLDLWWMTE